MVAVSVVTEKKHDMNVKTIRCSLLVEVRQSVIYRYHLVFMYISMLFFLCWVASVREEEFIFHLHFNSCSWHSAWSKHSTTGLRLFSLFSVSVSYSLSSFSINHLLSLLAWMKKEKQSPHWCLFILQTLQQPI